MCFCSGDENGITELYKNPFKFIHGENIPDEFVVNSVKSSFSIIVSSLKTWAHVSIQIQLDHFAFKFDCVHVQGNIYSITPEQSRDSNFRNPSYCNVLCTRSFRTSIVNFVTALLESN